MTGRGIVFVGSAAHTGPCVALAAELGVEAVSVAAERASGSSSFDLSRLAAYPPTQWDAFAAGDSSLLNLARLSLMSALITAGYVLPGLVSTRASVPVGWRAERNVLVSAGAVLCGGAALRHNVVVGAGAVIGNDVKVGHSVWIGAGALVGNEAQIDDGSVIGAGAIVSERVRIGRQCEIRPGQVCSVDVADQSFYSPMFDEVVRIYPVRPVVR